MACILIKTLDMFSRIAVHCIGFPRACLSEGKYGSLVAFESMPEDWPDIALIDIHITNSLPESSVEVENMFIDVFGEVQFDSE